MVTTACALRHGGSGVLCAGFTIDVSIGGIAPLSPALRLGCGRWLAQALKAADD
jgi:hypothetical protein